MNSDVKIILPALCLSHVISVHIPCLYNVYFCHWTRAL